MKKLFIVALALLLAISVMACSAPAPADPTPAAPEERTVSDGEKLYIPVIAMGFQHQFWQAVRIGAEQAAEDFGVEITFEGPEDETMVDKQLDILRAAIAKGPAAISMAAIDEQAVLFDLEEQKSKGIPIIGFDAGVGDIADVTATTDSLAAGAEAAKHAVEFLNGSGKVGIISHSQTVIDAVERVKGFVDYIEANAPDIEIVDIQYGDGDHLKSADIVKSMLQGDPEINLFYASNEGAAVGMYNGIKEINKIGEVILIGFDASKALKDAVRSGEVAGAITQNPVGMGYKSVEAAVRIINGESVPSFIDTGFYWYDASNMDEPHIAVLLYD